MGGLWYIKNNFDFRSAQQWFSSQSLELFGTGFDRVNTVLLMPKYDPDSLSPSFLSLFFLLLLDEGFPTVY